MEGVRGGPGNARTAFAGLQPLARSLAACDVRAEDYFACVADQLVDDDGFGYRRLALFQGWSGRFDPVPVAEHGFAELEALSGQLPPLDEWPLFHEALSNGAPSSPPTRTCTATFRPRSPARCGSAASSASRSLLTAAVSALHSQIVAAGTSSSSSRSSRG